MNKVQDARFEEAAVTLTLAAMRCERVNQDQEAVADPGFAVALARMRNTLSRFPHAVYVGPPVTQDELQAVLDLQSAVNALSCSITHRVAAGATIEAGKLSLEVYAPPLATMPSIAEARSYPQNGLCFGWGEISRVEDNQSATVA